MSARSRRGVALALALAAPAAAEDRVGVPLTPRAPGGLDIHQISTGRGNAALLVLPDGTTLLVDAGAARGDIPDADPRPDASRPPGEWVARYVRRALGDDARLDYAIVTHFHPDHMGWAAAADPLASNGAYRLRGITRVAEDLPIGVLIDRGWPSYDFPEPLDHPGVVNYRGFAEWRASRDLRVERIRPGAADQVTLVRQPAAHPGFEIRNVAGNGEVWTGDGDAVEQRFPDPAGVPVDLRPSENHCSIALRLRYGRFEYYTGGDLHGVPDPGEPEWHDMEAPVGAAIGSTDVHVVNHHGSIDPASPGFLAALRPRVHIVPAWRPSHPAPVVLKRLLATTAYDGPRDVFVTALRESTRIVIGPRAGRLASANGHVVVRVASGAETYRVVVVDDSDESGRVLSVHGPYHAR